MSMLYTAWCDAWDASDFLRMAKLKQYMPWHTHALSETLSATHKNFLFF